MNYQFFLILLVVWVLGNLHNLFGDTHSVHVEMQSDGHYRLSNKIEGDSIESSLRCVNFNSDALLQSYQQQLQSANLSEVEFEEFFKTLSLGLKGYTYFEE